MNLQILPNWCKKVGVALFIISSIPAVHDGYLNGLYGHPSDYIADYSIQVSIGSFLYHVSEILTIIGLVVYLLSKEKVEDDFINKLRLESYQLTALLGLGSSLILYSFSKSIELSLDYFINLFLLAYLIIFAIKKRSY